MIVSIFTSMSTAVKLRNEQSWILLNLVEIYLNDVLEVIYAWGYFHGVS